MSLSGNMIIKNGIKYDYPFIESCLSILPICDEFVFVEGYGEDGTYEKIVEFQKQQPKVKIFRHPWEKLHYSVLADLTNLSIEHCSSDYYFQIQADEGVHEKYHPEILSIVNGPKFDFAFLGVYHFYGSFRKVYKPKVFYDAFVRLAHKSTYPELRSCDDAMSLGCPASDSAKMQKLELQSTIKVHHYGYVRKPMALIAKQDEITKWWGWQERDEFFQKALDRGQICWNDKIKNDRLLPYNDTHPSPFANWIADREQIVEQGILV